MPGNRKLCLSSHEFEASWSSLMVTSPTDGRSFYKIRAEDRIGGCSSALPSFERRHSTVLAPPDGSR